MPWADQIYAVSTDPSVKSGRLEFESNEASIPLPDGRLALKRHDDDVEVSRE